MSTTPTSIAASEKKALTWSVILSLLLIFGGILAVTSCPHSPVSESPSLSVGCSFSAARAILSTDGNAARSEQ